MLDTVKKRSVYEPTQPGLVFPEKPSFDSLAAERLHLTQSALSHQFKELEERMGMQLFVRKTKPVRFTSAGLRLLQLSAVASL